MQKNIIIVTLLLLAQISKAQHIEFGGGLHFIRNDYDAQVVVTNPNSPNYAYTVPKTLEAAYTKMQLSLGYSYPFYESEQRNVNLFVGISGTTGSVSDFEKSSIMVPFLLNIEHKIRGNQSFGTGIGAAFNLFTTKYELRKFITPNFVVDYTINKNIFRVTLAPFAHSYKSFRNSDVARTYFSINYLKKFTKR